jgi:hypothetical protein
MKNSGFDQRKQKVNNQIIAKKVKLGNVGGGIVIQQIQPTSTKSSRFVIEIALGMLLPPFACLLTTAAYVSRFYLTGIWTSGMTESILTVLALFGLFVLSLVLFIIGVSGIGKTAFDYASEFDMDDFGTSIKDGYQRFVEYVKGYPNWFQAIKNMPKVIKPYLNFNMTDFNERLVAIILSLFVPGLGLIYRGRIWFGILSFVFTVVGYFAEFFPGLLLHLLVIITSGLIEKQLKVVAQDEVTHDEYDDVVHDEVAQEDNQST